MRVGSVTTEQQSRGRLQKTQNQKMRGQTLFMTIVQNVVSRSTCGRNMSLTRKSHASDTVDKRRSLNRAFITSCLLHVQLSQHQLVILRLDPWLLLLVVANPKHPMPTAVSSPQLAMPTFLSCVIYDGVNSLPFCALCSLVIGIGIGSTLSMWVFWRTVTSRVSRS